MKIKYIAFGLVLAAFSGCYQISYQLEEPTGAPVMAEANWQQSYAMGFYEPNAANDINTACPGGELVAVKSQQSALNVAMTVGTLGIAPATTMETHCQQEKVY